jgi:hypothetical protein
VENSLKHQWMRFDGWPVSSHLWLVILIAFLVFSVSVWRHGDRAPDTNAIGVVQHAVALHQNFTFGYAKSESAATKPSMFLAPLQSTVIAGVMSLDQNLAQSLQCHAWASQDKATTNCASDYRPFFFVQALILSLVPFFAWLMAWQLSGKKAIAWGAVVLVLLSGRQAFYVTSFSDNVFILPLFAALLFTLVVTLQSRYWLWIIATGLLCGLLALTQPIFAWIFYALLLLLSYWRATDGQNSRYFWQTAAQLVVPYLLVTGPWMWRNYWAFDTAALTEGYIASMLAERLAWNVMNGLELAVSFVWWLGGIGPDLASAAYPQEAWQRLDPAAAGGIHASVAEYSRQTLIAAGSLKSHLAYLLDTELWPRIGKHLSVTLAFIWRGLWVGGIWSLLAVPLAIAYAAVSISRRRADIIMPLSTCGLMLLMFAFVSADLPANSDIYIPMFSVLVAMLAGEWFRHRLMADGQGPA